MSLSDSATRLSLISRCDVNPANLPNAVLAGQITAGLWRGEGGISMAGNEDTGMKLMSAARDRA